MLKELCECLRGRYRWRGQSRRLDREDECAGFLPLEKQPKSRLRLEDLEEKRFETEGGTM